MMTNPPYPASPSLADTQFLTPSPAFKKQVWRVIAAIVCFLLVYLLLIVVASGLVYTCFWLSLLLLSAYASFWTIVIALGLICLSLMFFAFLLKFIFSSTTHDTSGSMEIKRPEHPKLFEFIDRLTAEVGAPKPKKVFLLPDVNASVFYNSSFWSMFLPVRKNLNIGLGLVNSLNLSEFKAVLSHEFGHFSQRSMKMGSYVYTVNQVVHNLVFKYDR